MRILFIEDDRATQVSVGEWFRLIFKFEVVSAYNGQEALDILLRDTRFDIIILDCRMPIMDGEEFLEHYRGTIPVIYFTAFSSPPPRPVAAEVPKPYDIKALVSTMRQICGETTIEEKKGEEP